MQTAAVRRPAAWAAALALAAVALAGGARADITLNANTDRPGADFFSFDLPEANSQLCRAMCARHAKCMAYTYVRPGHQGPRARCYLKRTAPPSRSSNCCASGAKSERGRITSTVFPGDGAVRAVPSVPPGIRAQSYGQNQRQTGFALRPLLVVLIQARPQQMSAARFVRPGGASAYFDQLVFGPREPNIASYYREMSNGGFAWIKAAVIGPVTSSATPNAWQDAIRLADANGFRFADFDQDSDGVVRQDELSILVIDNFTWCGGQTQFVSRRAGSGDSEVGVEVQVAAMGINCGLDSFAHEVGHTLNMGEDLYSDACRSQNYTLMSCTGGAAATEATTRPNPLASFHLDPWNKWRLGWTYPDFVSTRAIPRNIRLAAPQSDFETPYILYDPRRGMSEFYILEYRNPAAPSRGPGATAMNGGVGGYDVNVPGSGLVIWYVQTRNAEGEARETVIQIRADRPGRAANQPVDWVLDTAVNANDVASDTNGDGRPDLIMPGADGVMQSVPHANDTALNQWLVFVSTDPLRQRGRLVPFQPGSPPIRLKWFDDADLGVQIRVLRDGPFAQATGATSIPVRIEGVAPGGVQPIFIDPRLIAANPPYYPVLPGSNIPTDIERAPQPRRPPEAKPDTRRDWQQQSPPPSSKEILDQQKGSAKTEENVAPPPEPAKDKSRPEEKQAPPPYQEEKEAPPSLTHQDAPASSWRMEDNIDRPGGDLMGPSEVQSDPQYCRALCDGDKRCMAWTYVRPGVQGPGAMCWLKDRVPPAQKNPCCVSGVR